MNVPRECNNSSFLNESMLTKEYSDIYLHMNTSRNSHLKLPLTNYSEMLCILWKALPEQQQLIFKLD